MIGANRTCTDLYEFEYANMILPERFATLARKNGVKRFIHFSSVGASENSESYDLRSKWIGE